MATETKTFYPGAYEDSVGVAIKNGTNPVDKGSTNTTYAEILGAYFTNSGETYCFWPFDVSTIPKNAVIDSVSCTVKAARTTTQTGTHTSIQLYSGDIAKGNEYMLPTTTTTVTTISLEPGTWTRDELSSIRLQTYVENGYSQQYGLRFYGADLTVTYTYQNEKFMLKLSGDYKDIARTFKKANDIWVEQTDLANVIEDGVRYQNGGEYVAPVQKISFTIAGTSYQAEEGMTWAEWCDSSYNPGGFSATTSGVYHSGTDKYVCDSSYKLIKTSATITSGYAYGLTY